MMLDHFNRFQSDEPLIRMPGVRQSQADPGEVVAQADGEQGEH